MPSIFEELMSQNRELTEGISARRRSTPAPAEKKCICCNRIKVESFKKLREAEDLDALDKQFAVDPTSEDTDEVVLVIDPELNDEDEVPEDAAEEMVGDLVYKCPICGANYVCNCDAEKVEGIEVDEDGVPTECPICGDDAGQILIGEIAPASEAGDPSQTDPVDSDDVAEDDQEDVEESVSPDANKDDESQKESCKESITEDFEGEEEHDFGNLELVDPATDAPSVEINAETVTLSLDDKRFESLMNKMIAENYKNSPSFKVTRVSASGSKLKVEYVVRDGKNNIKGSFIGEGFSRKSRSMKISFKDKGAFTESFTKTPSFIVECVRIRNRVIPTTLSYDFKKKVNESVYRVYGEVNSKNK